MALTILALLYLTVLILLTNAATRLRISHRHLRVLQAAMPALIAIQMLNRMSNPNADHWFQLLHLLPMCASTAIMLLLIRFESPWRHIERLVSISGGTAPPTFDSQRPIHRLALLLMIFALALLYWRSNPGAGLPDPLADYASPEGALINLTANATMYVWLALLGVGLLVRRDWTHAVQRLGLRFPTRVDLLAGIGLGCILYLGASLLTLLWQNMTPASTFEWQTAAARKLFDSFSSSLILGALLALLTAIGEETLFRGALQPVFGIVFVSLFFTAIHVQYAATPAAAIIFVLSLAFGLARARLSATSAMIAHFVYNMIPFLLASLA